MSLANKITFTRIMLIPVFLIFILPFPEWFPGSLSLNAFINKTGYYIGLLIFVIAAATDSVDGYIARKTNTVTRMGKFLDPIADKLLLISAFVALVYRQELSVWAALIIISREFVVTGFRVIAAGEGVVIAANIWGKLKTISQVIAVTLIMLRGHPFDVFNKVPIDKYFLFIAIVLTLYSGYDYIKKGSKIIFGENENISK